MKPYPRRYVCPYNGMPTRCHVCQRSVPHQVEQWSVEPGECPTHQIPLVEPKP